MASKLNSHCVFKEVFIGFSLLNNSQTDGRQRPIGLLSLEDKIVERAVLNAIHEQEFLGSSYGFRPKRNPHRALDALYA